jgi:hypothetical protein
MDYGEGESVGGAAGRDTAWNARIGGEPSLAEWRVIELMEEFRRRQQRRPDVAVRPWWTRGEAVGAERVGFVVEYCPGGRESAELVVRGCRVTVEGPGGVVEAGLDLARGWLLDGLDTGSPETLANHLVRLADRLLEEAA